MTAQPTTAQYKMHLRLTRWRRMLQADAARVAASSRLLSAKQRHADVQDAHEQAERRLGVENAAHKERMARQVHPAAPATSTRHLTAQKLALLFGCNGRCHTGASRTMQLNRLKHVP